MHPNLAERIVCLTHFSASCVEYSANRLIDGELVVKLHCLGRGQHVRLNLPPFQEFQGLAWNFKAFLHPAREDYDLGAMIEQFLHVSLLNAGHMISACLAPVPFSRSTRKKLCILIRLGPAFYLEPSPGDVLDPWRAVFVFHHNNIVRQPSGGFSALFVCESPAQMNSHASS